MSGYNWDSTSVWNEKSELIVCPYDRSHIVQRRRIPYHLVKCAKRHKDVHLEICPYNASHRVPEAQIVCHIANCPDKHKIELLTPSEFVQPGKEGCIPHSEFVQSKFEMAKLQSDQKKMEGSSAKGIQLDDSSDFKSLDKRLKSILTGRSFQTQAASGSDGCDLHDTSGYDLPSPNRRHRPQLRPLRSLPETLKCLLVDRRVNLG